MMQLEKWKGKRITVALSGGADSTALLFFLKEESVRCGFTLSAVHCEHGIRGDESLRDQAFVKGVCSRLDVPCFFFSDDCLKGASREKISVETYARNFRRRVFSLLVQEGKTDYIATAHHQKDVAETILFRLCRGTSLSGMVGMKEEDGIFLRPFLTWKKEDILTFLRERGLSYCEDSSNVDVGFTRNKIRLQVLPVLEEICPQSTVNIAKFSFLVNEEEEFLQRESEKLIQNVPPAWTGDTGIRITPCKEKVLFRRATLQALKTLGLEKDYTSAHLEDVFALQGKQTGSKSILPSGVYALKCYEGIALLTDGDEGKSAYEVVSSQNPITGEFEGKVLCYDEDALPKGASVRFFQTGDVFKKFGGGKKSLKKYFIDEKIPQKKRAEIPVVAEGNTVYIVCGVEISDAVKVTEQTKNIKYIALRKK